MAADCRGIVWRYLAAIEQVAQVLLGAVLH